MNFEKIAMHRAQKQHEFLLKHKDEEDPRERDHGKRFSTYAELLDKDQRMAAAGSELDRAFKASEEDYENHKLMKPRFEDFKLRFVGPHDQVMDSATTFTASVEPTTILKSEQKEEGEREASLAQYKEHHFAEDHSQKS